MRLRLILAGLMLLPLVHAIEPLPKEAGFNGYVSPGISHLSFRDNLVAGAGSLEVGNPRVDSLDGRAKREDTANPTLTGELGYKFAERDLYLFFGNQLEDFLRLDNSTALGARFQAGGESIWEVSALFSTVPTQVWEDPYLVGADREETDRSSGGMRAGVANLAGTGWEISFTARQVEIDEERSGEGQGLDAATRDLLRRDGDAARVDILRPWVLNARHTLITSVNFGVYDAEGDAMSREGYGCQVSHVWHAGRLRVISNLSLSRSEFDEENPVFGEMQDETDWMASVTGLYSGIFGRPNLSAMGSVLFAERTSDIKFHESDASVVSLGALYRF